MGVCHRKSSPRGGGLVTLTVTNPHLAPPMPVWGVVGHNIDRCINFFQNSLDVPPKNQGGEGASAPIYRLM